MRRLLSIAFWFHVLLLVGLGWRLVAPRQAAAACRPAAVVQAGHAQGAYHQPAPGHEHDAIGNEALATGKELRPVSGGSWALLPNTLGRLLPGNDFDQYPRLKRRLRSGAPALRARLQASILPNAP